MFPIFERHGSYHFVCASNHSPTPHFDLWQKKSPGETHRHGTGDERRSAWINCKCLNLNQSQGIFFFGGGAIGGQVTMLTVATVRNLTCWVNKKGCDTKWFIYIYTVYISSLFWGVGCFVSFYFCWNDFFVLISIDRHVRDFKTWW